MPTIKNLLYLDEYKMYSISSQLFGGLTEYLTSRDEHSEDRRDRQSGPIWSGRVMADILSSHTSTEERRFLHDYSYTLFEDALREQGKLKDVFAANIDEIADSLSDANFVAIRAKAIFNDMQAIKSMLSQFNSIGESLTYITAHTAGVIATDSHGDDSKRQAQVREATRKKQLLDLAKSTGLRMDPEYLQSLGVIMAYGFGDDFEVQQKIGPYTVSAILQREHFREPSNLVVKKYSRFSQQELVLLGTVAQGIQSDLPEAVSQASKSLEDAVESATANTPDMDMRDALMLILQQLYVTETAINGKKANELIIDPIALYREL